MSRERALALFRLLVAEADERAREAARDAAAIETSGEEVNSHDERQAA